MVRNPCGTFAADARYREEERTPPLCGVFTLELVRRRQQRAWRQLSFYGRRSACVPGVDRLRLCRARAGVKGAALSSHAWGPAASSLSAHSWSGEARS